MHLHECNTNVAIINAKNAYFLGENISKKYWDARRR